MNMEADLQYMYEAYNQSKARMLAEGCYEPDEIENFAIDDAHDKTGDLSGDADYRYELGWEFYKRLENGEWK